MKFASVSYMAKSNGNLGPRANFLGLEWEDPKPKKKKKKKVISKPKKKKKLKANLHNPKTKSSSYPKTHLEAIDEFGQGTTRTLQEVMNLINVAENPQDIITYEVEYLDDE